MSESKCRVLLVEDDAALRNVLLLSLRKAGFIVEGATDGAAAIGRLGESQFDVMVSDIEMPGVGGMELLRRVRERDLDLPVILMTGSPSMESAVDAVAYGALRYVIKPFDIQVLIQAIQFGFKIRRMAQLKREAFAHLGASGEMPADRAGLEARFALALDGIWMAYQPIVSWSRHAVIAYEALVRSAEPTMSDPGILIGAAERLERLPDLGRTIRSRVAAASTDTPADIVLYVNLHPQDLFDDELFQATSPLAPLASRVVLEITERGSLDSIRNTRERVATLRAMGFRVAVDDLGAGYAGLSSLVQLEPEVVKLDMSLVRNIDKEPTKQRLVGSMTQLCVDMGIQVVAEGIENAAERDTIVGLGCDLMQGYAFGRPARSFAQPTWDA